MNKKNIAKKNPTGKVSAERKSVPWRYRFLTVVCGLLLVVGFFFAARQHFASFDFRVKNSRLKKQIEELEADKRRLLLSKEIALSHTEIKKAAKKIGMTDAPSGNVSNPLVNVPLQKKPAAEKTSVEKLKPTAAPSPKADVKTEVKTTEPKKETKKPESEVKKLPEAKDKQNKNKPAQITKK